MCDPHFAAQHPGSAEMLEEHHLGGKDKSKLQEGVVSSERSRKLQPQLQAIQGPTQKKGRCIRARFPDCPNRDWDVPLWTGHRYRCHKGVTEEQKAEHNAFCETCAWGNTKSHVCPAHGQSVLPKTIRCAPQRVFYTEQSDTQGAEPRSEIRPFISRLDPLLPTPMDSLSPTPMDPLPMDPLSPTPMDPLSPTPMDPRSPTPMDPLSPTPMGPRYPTPMDCLPPAKEEFLSKWLSTVPQHWKVDAPASTEDLEKIAASLIGWKRVCAGLALGISEDEEAEITRKYPNLDSQRLATLRKWRSKHEQHATYRNLARCFLRADMPLMVSEVCKTLGATTSTAGISLSVTKLVSAPPSRHPSTTRTSSPDKSKLQEGVVSSELSRKLQPQLQAIQGPTQKKGRCICPDCPNRDRDVPLWTGHHYSCHEGATEEQKAEHNAFCEACAWGITKSLVCPVHGESVLPEAIGCAPQRVYTEQSDTQEADASVEPQLPSAPTDPLPPTPMDSLPPAKEDFLCNMLATVPQQYLVDAPTSTDDLKKIAASLISWKRACAGLGISEDEEEEIARENASLNSQRLATLRKWRSKHEQHATYRNLARCFLRADMPLMVSEVCKTLGATTSTAEPQKGEKPVQPAKPEKPVSKPPAEETKTTTHIEDQSLHPKPPTSSEGNACDDDEKDWALYIQVASQVTEEEWEHASVASDQLWDELMLTVRDKVNYKGVTLMETQEGPQPHPEIVIGVKVSTSDLNIPNLYKGVSVRVIQDDIIAEKLANGNRRHGSPVLRPGDSVAKEATPETYGSLGCFLKSSSENSAVFFVTCYHNFEHEERPGPTPYDVRVVPPQKGEPIQVNEITRGEYHVGIEEREESDVCLVKLAEGVEWDNTISNDGKSVVLKGIHKGRWPRAFKLLCKNGAESGYTEGFIRTTDLQTNPEPLVRRSFEIYSGSKCKAICARGDSGSVFAYKEDGNVAGLLYKGSRKREHTLHAHESGTYIGSTTVGFAYPFHILCDRLQRLDCSLKQLEVPPPEGAVSS